MLKKLLIYKSESFNPYFNLALEKFLFDTLEKDTLILYLWQNKNTVVIGKNQNPWAECRVEELKNANGFLARRLSGGGAVFHDLGNLNFTFICANEDYSIQKNVSAIKLACSYLNVNAEISGRNDILINEKKFSGNAFYSSQGKSYHHGTLLISSELNKVENFLTPPREKLNAKGIKSVRSRVVNLNDINPQITVEAMQNALISATSKVFLLKPNLMPATTPPNDLILFFSDWNFIFGKTIPFTVSLSKRFLWGSVDLNLEITDGKIAKTQLYTDALDENLSALVEKALCNCELSLSIIKKQLQAHVLPQQASDIANLIKENLL